MFYGGIHYLNRLYVIIIKGIETNMWLRPQNCSFVSFNNHLVQLKTQNMMKLIIMTMMMIMKIIKMMMIMMIRKMIMTMIMTNDNLDDN